MYYLAVCITSYDVSSASIAVRSTSAVGFVFARIDNASGQLCTSIITTEQLEGGSIKYKIDSFRSPHKSGLVQA